MFARSTGMRGSAERLIRGPTKERRPADDFFLVSRKWEEIYTLRASRQNGNSYLTHLYDRTVTVREEIRGLPGGFFLAAATRELAVPRCARPQEHPVGGCRNRRFLSVRLTDFGQVERSGVGLCQLEPCDQPGVADGRRQRTGSGCRGFWDWVGQWREHNTQR